MICENCGKEHDGSYASGRFCSKECAKSFSTKNLHGQLKEAKCIDCGKIIYIGKRASNKKCRCEECNKKHKQIKCSICGSFYDPSSGGCKNDFCKKHNVKQFEIFIKYFGFNKTKLGTFEVENEFNRIRNILYDLYWNKNMSSTDIKKYFNYDKKHSIIQNTFKYLDIPIRNFKQSSTNAVLQGKIKYDYTSNKYKSCKHITWNNKEVFLRSSYELDYAKELDKHQINYEVEYFHIKYWNSQLNEYKYAIPDFYIPSTNTIVEIKSSWTTNYQQLKDKENEYKKLGYNYKLIFEHQEYDSIDNIDKTKYRNENNIIINNHIYKQKEGYHWIYKDNKQLRCNKNDINKYLNDGWKIGRIHYNNKIKFY